jgi:hypothetical protein
MGLSKPYQKFPFGLFIWFLALIVLMLFAVVISPDRAPPKPRTFTREEQELRDRVNFERFVKQIRDDDEKKLNAERARQAREGY